MKNECVKKVSGVHPDIEKNFELDFRNFIPSCFEEEKLWKFYKCLQVLAFRYPEDKELGRLFEESESRVIMMVKPYKISAYLEWKSYGSNGLGVIDFIEDANGVQARRFERDNGYLPRSAEELDAYSNSDEEWAEYQKNHPKNPSPDDTEQKLFS